MLLRSDGSRRKSRRIPKGMDLLHTPRLNKGTAFSEKERDDFHLRGLLPARILTPEIQEARVIENFRGKASDIEKYIFLVALQDRNERLFYRTVINHVEEMMPIIYTPEVGDACRNYAHIWRRPQGMFISANDRGRVESILRNWPEEDVRIIVVTDGERILGLGDLGANGMGISVGKLSLYTVCAGVNPTLSLPVTLDVGTDNESLLEDPFYIGLTQHRVRGQDYDDLVDEFIDAVHKVFPDAIVQFEDFGNRNAFRLLHKYRDKICCFNDDIQGTAAVAVAGLLSAARIAESDLTDQRVLFLGAGEAAIGIANLLVSVMMEAGLSEPEARRRIWLIDSRGLVVEGREGLQEQKLPYTQPHDAVSDVRTVIETVKPAALIGVSGQAQAFTQPIIEAMTSCNKRPIVFALSNPTSKAECTAEQAYQWTQGAAIFASGSPFPPVRYGGRTLVPGQGNNAYIFPGLGLGLIASRAERVTDAMFLAAARTVADCVTQESLDRGCIYPPLTDIRRVSFAIAVEVARVAYDTGLARTPRPESLGECIQAHVYNPEYEAGLGS